MEKGWRICVGIVLLNKNKNIFLGERIDNKGAWQMPQGGVNIGINEKLMDAAKRELKEETGVSSIELLSECKDWHYYYLPNYLSSKLWKGRFVGQKQKWFAFNFHGEDDEIDISNHKSPEFSNWNWAEPKEVKKKAIDFKKEIYDEVLNEFKDFIN
tara:strand:+ start:53 stop:520 length:468 start_codon:yes stop_codon:yes gene_type:complete